MSNALENEELLDAITRHVFLVMLSVSWPKLSYQISDVIVEISDGDAGKKEIAEEFRTNPQWRLLPETWRKKLVNLEGRARSLLGHASISFAARGMAVLPVTRAQEIFAGLRNLRAEMDQYRDEFVEEYEAILENLETRLDTDLFKKVQSKLPESAEVARKFGIVWAIIPAGGRSNVTPEQLDAIELALNNAGYDESAPAREVLQTLRSSLEPTQISDEQAAELITEARSQMNQFTREMFENMAREPRRLLLEATNNLREALANPQRMVRNGTIEQVRRAFQMVEGFAFLAGDSLLAEIRRCRERMEDVTPQQLNTDIEIGARLASNLQGVAAAAADARAATEAMRQFRGIRIRNGHPQPTGRVHADIAEDEESEGSRSADQESPV